MTCCAERLSIQWVQQQAAVAAVWSNMVHDGRQTLCSEPPTHTVVRLDCPGWAIPAVRIEQEVSSAGASVVAVVAPSTG